MQKSISVFLFCLWQEAPVVITQKDNYSAVNQMVAVAYHPGAVISRDSSEYFQSACRECDKCKYFSDG
jgi:hypothetical protein